MSNLTPANESNPLELLSLINPLIDFMQEKEYNFFLVAGKDGISTRHAFGNPLDVAGMVLAMMEKNEEIAIIIKDAVENYVANLELKKQPTPKFPKGGVFK